MDDLYAQNKQVIVSVHAVKRAREKNIAYPDQVYHAIKTGKVKRFGKHGIKFVCKSIICVGEEIGQIILIKTIERGN